MVIRFKFWEEYKRKRTVAKLISDGILTPVTSFEQYSQLVKDAKTNAEHRLYTNNYLMPGEVQRLISLNAFYRVKIDNGLAFVDDEISHYYMFLHVDLEKEIHIPKLDRTILTEVIYQEDNIRQSQRDFERRLGESEFIHTSTYKQIHQIPQIPPEKYWKKYESYMKLLESEGKKICSPTNKQLKQFEEIYRQQIDMYVQKKFTKRERKKQRDAGYLTCVSDDVGNLYAIRVSADVHGGAIAANQKYIGNIYAPILMFNIFRPFYEYMPQDPEQRKEYMRSKSFGWIATTNTASLRMHKAIGLDSTGKAMNQFVLPAAPKK